MSTSEDHSDAPVALQKSMSEESRVADESSSSPLRPNQRSFTVTSPERAWKSRTNTLKLSDASNPVTHALLLAKIRQKVADFLNTWLTLAYRDFVVEPELADMLTAFLTEKIKKSKGADVKVASTLREIRAKMMTVPVASRPELSSPFQAPEDRSALDSMNPDIFSYHTMDVCEQLTLLDFKVMSSIQPQEFLHQAWNKEGKELNAPGILFYTKWFNDRAHWFATQLLQEESAKVRARGIEKLVKWAARFYEIQNYNGVFEVLACLNSAPIARLKLTWAEVTAGTMERLEAINQAMSPEGNYARYRELLANANPPYLPYLGSFLTDCTFIDDNNDDITETSEGAKLINVEKLKLLGRSIAQFLRSTQTPFDLASNPSLQLLICAGQVWSDEELFKISNIREDPSETKDFEVVHRKFAASSLSPKKYFTQGRKKGHAKSSTVESVGELEERDWTLLEAGATAQTIEDDTVLIEQGETAKGFWKILSGAIRVEKVLGEDKSGKEVKEVVQQLGTGNLAGEYALLPRPFCLSRYRYTALRGAKLNFVELGHIRDIMSSEPETSANIYRMIALHTCQSLSGFRSAASRTTKNQGIGKKGLDAHNEAKRSFQERFALGESSPLIKEFRCFLKGTLLKQSGSLYISSKYFCFYAGKMALKTREIIPIQGIDNITLSLTEVQLVLMADSLQMSIFVFQDEKEAKECYLLMMKIWQQDQVPH